VSAAHECATGGVDHERGLRAEIAALPLGPNLPVAFCQCGTRLQFERAEFRGWVNQSTGWRCWCDGCIDGEYLPDIGCRTYVKSGEGASPWDALDDLAAVHFNCMPEELMEAAT